jgi:hypothetical protein
LASDSLAAFKSSERARTCNLRRIAAHPTGGYFTHFEKPDATVAAIRSVFVSED